MERLRIFPLVLAAVSIAAICVPVQAQTVEDPAAAHRKAKDVRPYDPPVPFLPGAQTPGPVQTIEFRTAEQMSQQDRNLLADAQSSIAERAEFAGLEFNQGQWSYFQMVCPALPNHLLLRFTRNGGAGDVSLFSASIPRSGAGHVRIIPIQRRGYSLFSPAPINALTISAFNHIRAEEPAESTPGWLATGLCYAALAGARPQAALYENPAAQNSPMAAPAMMEILGNGGAVIRFTDVAASSRPMEWTMTFNGNGRLLKATHSPASLITEKPVSPSIVEPRGMPIPEATMEKGMPVPAIDPSQNFKPIPPDSGAPKLRPIPGPTQPQPPPEH
jgi:hypothetical protein